MSYTKITNFTTKDATNEIIVGAEIDDEFDAISTAIAINDAHIVDATAAHEASAISYAGGTGMSATDVESAIDELATEKANLASPSFTTPALGTPSAGVLTNCTALPLATGVTGTLPDDNGGTGQSTYSTGDILYASGSNTLAKRTVGSIGQVLTVSGGVPTWGSPITSGTVIATTSGTSNDITLNFSTAKRIIVAMNGVSTNGSSPIQIQIGDAGGIEATGFASTSTVTGTGVAIGTSTTGFILTAGTTYTTAAEAHSGIFTLINVDANTWVFSGVMCSSVYTFAAAGTKTLSGTLDRVSLTTVGGVNTFDAGQFQIFYE